MVVLLLLMVMLVMLMLTLMMLMLMRDKTEGASCGSIRNRLLSTVVIFAARLFSTGSLRVRRSGPSFVLASIAR